MERRFIEPRYEPSEKCVLRHLEQACADVVSGLRFDVTGLPIVSVRYAGLTDGVLLEVVIEVPDRAVADRIEMLTVGRALVCPWVVLENNGPEYLVGWLCETAANLLAHEVAESISYRGARVFDLHRLAAGPSPFPELRVGDPVRVTVPNVGPWTLPVKRLEDEMKRVVVEFAYSGGAQELSYLRSEVTRVSAK